MFHTNMTITSPTNKTTIVATVTKQTKNKASAHSSNTVLIGGVEPKMWGPAVFLFFTLPMSQS